MMNKTKEDQYSAKDIQVLENIEAVRKRPGMYVGSTEEQGWHHLFQEVIDNSIDESVAGYCHKVKITLSTDQRTVIVEDDGRGIPIEIHPETKRSTLETIFTVLHSGGKFDNKVYKTSGGLHGVGLTAVNALSENLKVWSKRSGKTENLEFREGILISSQITATPEAENGITINFTPDKKVFKEFTHFRIELIQNRLKELAYLNPNLSLDFLTSPQAMPITYHYDSGLAGWVQETNVNEHLENTEICYEERTSRDKEEYFYLSFAWQYQQGQKKFFIKSFCNNISTAGGGTHVEGFENGFVAACRDWIKEKYPHLKISILKDDILEGLTSILAVRIQDPEFTGQTKDRLANKKVRELVKNATSELVKIFLQNHPVSAEAISKKIIDTAQIRLKIEEQQELLRGETRLNAVLPGKLADCMSKNPEETELFIVEGESAGGTAKLGRDRNIQAVLALKGKIINVEKAERVKIFKNEEIKNLVNALGFNAQEAAHNYYNRFHSKVGENIEQQELQILEDFIYENASGEKQEIKAHSPLSSEQLATLVEETRQSLLKKLRYGKIVIMADADPDGKHIECLALTFFAHYFRYLIEEHRLYLAVPPLYRIQSKKETRYVYNDHELEMFRQENKGSFNIQRFKGLGEMNAQQLRETTMALRKRCLHELLFPDAPTIEQIIQDLMGPKSDQRKKRLESGDHKNAQLTVTDNQVDIGQALIVKFLEYAYAVVEDRALPQLYDGLKPVQRRILYTLYQSNLFPNKQHRKAAKIVGEVMGNYHPHSDSSIYQAMVKMTQDFNYRYPLVDGQGNWGSIDGDPAAAMRYTEARLTKFGLYLLEDLPFETVEWIDNYDETQKEPKILPANLNLLLNGCSGIAVGMSTNIPPHNLGEVVRAAISLIHEPELNLDQLLTYLPGPDFPTGGQILERENLRNIYEKGEGTIYIRAKAEIISSKQERNNSQLFSSKQEKDKKDSIKITEIPYKVNKANLVESINKIIKDKKIEGLRSVADYSNWEEVVDIRLRFDPNYDGEVILNQLYKSTRLQNSFSVKMRALIDDQPKIFGLKEILQAFIIQRLDNIQKKAQFIYLGNQKELLNLETRRFIIENYREIAEIVQNSLSEEARDEELKKRFKLEDETINRILDTQSSFRQFTPERKEKLENEISKLHQDNTNQQLLINNQKERETRLIQELEELASNYSRDQRKTTFSSEVRWIEERKLIPAHEERIILLSRQENKREEKIRSYLTVHNLNALEATNIPSQGKELKTQGDNWAMMKLNRRDDLWCFSNYGRMYIVNFYKFNAVNKPVNFEEYDSKKKPWIKFQAKGEFITYALPAKEEFTENLLIIITKRGKIKVWKTEQLAKSGKGGKSLIDIYKKARVKCSLHQLQFEEHKTADCCDKSQGIQAYARCANFHELQIQIKSCPNCQTTWTGSGDEIIKVIFANENDELEIIRKSKGKDGKVKNSKISAYRQVRKKIIVNINGQEEKIIACCSQHQSTVITHKTDHKNANNACSIICMVGKELGKKIKECSDCQNSEFFAKQLKKQVRCAEAVDLLKITENANKENLFLLLIKGDSNCEKKSLIATKNWLGSDAKIKKTIYCRDHSLKLEGASEELRIREEEERTKKGELIEEVLATTLLPALDKKEIIIKAKIKLTEELKRKIDNSPVLAIKDDEAVKGRKESLEKEQVANYEKLVAERKAEEKKLTEIEEGVKKCKKCQKYCNKHEILVKEQAEKHKFQEQAEKDQKCEKCYKKIEENEKVKKETKKLQDELLEYKTTQPQSSKEIQKQEKELAKKQEKFEKLRHEVFASHRRCEEIKKLEETIKECTNCKKQKELKFKKLIENPLRRVCLVDKEQKTEIYLLSKKSVCWYNKKDLISFLEDDKKRRIQLYKGKNSITDLWI